MSLWTSVQPEDVDRQRKWSDETFGPGERLGGVLAHIKEEVEEVREHPHDISEWADLLILVLDGATRQGFTGVEVLSAYHDKMERNEARTWPDWREFSQDQPINHVRDAEERGQEAGLA